MERSMSHDLGAIETKGVTTILPSESSDGDGIGHVPQDSLTAEKIEAPDSSLQDKDEDEKEYPEFRKTILIIVALYLSLFLISLDRSIIATAIPQLTDDFHSLGDIGWYGSAFAITGCAFQLIFGRIYTFYSPKYVFLGAVGLFELGSLICGVAPNSKAFILGRAIAGLGSSGIMGGTIVLTVHILPLRKRPMYQGFMASIFLVASVSGPLLGGVFTTDATWRWCFYINLPIGAVTIILIILFLQLPKIEKKKSLTFREQIDQLDPIGTFCLLTGVICLLLALQWGGSTYAWNDSRIIALFILFGLLSIAFIAVQIHLQEKATVPPRILGYRSVTSSAFFAFCISASLTVISAYLPVWFQAIEGVNAVQSGIRILPLILAVLVASIFAGGLVTAIGYYTPVLIACSIIMSIGGGLLTTFTVSTPEPLWIGYQVVFGFGVGLGQQQAGLAAQTVLADKDVPTGVAIKFFGQALGSAVFVSVAQNVLSNRLIAGLAGIPGFDAQQVVNMGATELRGIVPPQLLGVVLEAYNAALMRVFVVGLAMGCASMLGAAATEWRSVKGKKKRGMMGA
ncbi:hypothetical protein MMC11_002322 [Xylographa trunciseda]|nr:hypothetical protein [Xylographa trunciseda]